MSTPVFIDLNGNTARIDPQRGVTGFIKLTVYTQAGYSDDGNLVSHGQVVEVYIQPTHADALAQALLNSHGEQS